MVWVLILSINLILALAFAVVHRKDGQMKYISLFFILLPLLGVVLFYGAMGMWKLMEKHSYDRETLIKRLAIQRQEDFPETETELNITALEDIMAYGNNYEKRLLILNQLKKDIHTNYKEVLAAEEDKDSESAHYVASAKMEVYRNLRDIEKKSFLAYQEKPKSRERFVYLLKSMAELINSKLLSCSEADIYKRKYCDCIRKVSKEMILQLEEEHVECYLSYLVDLKEDNQLLSVWKEIPKDKRNENNYIKMLEYYYQHNDKNSFYEVLDELCSSNIVLSPEGIHIVRFWRLERNKDVGI